MSVATAQRYRFKGVEAEDATMRVALRTRSPRPRWKGDWKLPVRGRISSEFGVLRLRNGRPVGRHNGVDIAAPVGTAIRAPAAGRVVLVRSFRKYGNAVVLDHGRGVTSMYLHMKAARVRLGAPVRRGQVVGTIGATGAATGPHLHWGVYARGVPVSPLEWVRSSSSVLAGCRPASLALAQRSSGPRNRGSRLRRASRAGKQFQKAR